MQLISKTTKSNWGKLGTNQAERLVSRANKKLSKKTAIPAEYLRKKTSKKVIENLVEYIHAYSIPTESVVYSLSMQKLEAYGLYRPDIGFLTHVEKALSEFNFKQDHKIPLVPECASEYDFIGAVYQALCSEGKKNVKGSYYTPESVAQEMTAGFSFSNNQILLDPCCGSGSILMSTACPEPSQLLGYDLDPIAVYIARVNLLCKYCTMEFEPAVFVADFLQETKLPHSERAISFIATNPPWGAEINSTELRYPNITSGESSSLFLAKALDLIELDGSISFLFPKSIMNIAVHQDIRRYMLLNSKLRRVKYYPNLFTGVTTEFVDIFLEKKGISQKTVVDRNHSVFEVNSDLFLQDETCTFRLIPEEESNVLSHVIDKCEYDLSESIWALGIVTGDNKRKLLDHPSENTEPIITGKEVRPYLLKPLNKYIVFDPSQFQQMAKEKYYRAEEKLVYKFISKKLVFAFDNSGALCLNSANVLIPNVPNMSIKTVAAFLNSPLYQFLYICMFDDCKVLKGNLSKLPFPKLSTKENNEIETLVTECQVNNNYDAVQKYIFDYFEIDDNTRAHIERFVNGKA